MSLSNAREKLESVGNVNTDVRACANAESNAIDKSSAGKDGSAVNNLEVMMASGTWVFCSIGMMIFNKLALEEFPLSSSLVAIQLAFTVVIVTLAGWHSLRIGSLYDFLRWSLVAPFFAGVLLTSMFALRDAPLSLVIVFRGLAPLFSLTVEMFYPTPYKLTPATIRSLVLLLLGIGMYVKDVERGHLAAIGWVILNNMFVVGDRLLQRLMLAKDQWPVDMSKSACTLANNFLGLIPISIAVVVAGEHRQVHSTAASLDAEGISWIILSCFVGAGIAYAGIWTQSLVNATSFLVLATSNKFFVILIEVFVMKDGNLTWMQFLGATLTILSGVAYGKAREAPEAQHSQEALQESKPLRPNKA